MHSLGFGLNLVLQCDRLDALAKRRVALVFEHAVLAFLGKTSYRVPSGISIPTRMHTLDRMQTRLRLAPSFPRAIFGAEPARAQVQVETTCISLLGIVDGSVAFRRTRPRVVGASRIASLSLKTHEANPLRSHYDGQAEEHLHQMAHAMGRSWYSSRGGRGSVDEVCLMFVTRSPDVAPAAFTKHLRQELSFPEIGPKNVQTPGQNTQVSVQGDYRDHDGRFQHIQNRHQG